MCVFCLSLSQMASNIGSSIRAKIRIFLTNLKRWRLMSLCRSSGKFSISISSFTPLVAAQLYRSACLTLLLRSSGNRRWLIHCSTSRPLSCISSFLRPRACRKFCMLPMRIAKSKSPDPMMAIVKRTSHSK
ncbi:hypothetical protein V8G54_011633 [Vigna mungo]|uniref:Uncharacterized protein n=1 Tax=Vigna mungo TaxID=3915 RepID=A0AAQ3NRZ2_VIGMU